MNIGCIPSKALLNSSEKFVEISNHAAEHGIKTSKIDLDLNVLMDRKTKIVKKLTTGIGFLFKKNKITHIPGMAIPGICVILFFLNKKPIPVVSFFTILVLRSIKTFRSKSIFDVFIPCSAA